MTPLHDVEALVHLAEGGPGLAQSWAASRLAVVAPERLTTLPAADEIHDLIAVAAPPGLERALVDSLDGIEPSAPLLVDVAARLGLVRDPRAMAAALRACLAGEPTHDLTALLAIGTLGQATPDDLALAAGMRTPESQMVLPVLVIQVAARQGALDEAATAVVRALMATGDPDALVWLVGMFGAPHLRAHPTTVDEAVAVGAARAGRPPPRVARHKGSRVRGFQAAVRELADGLPGPLPAVLRAIARADYPVSGAMVAVASWARCFTPDDPVTDVLARGAHLQPDAMAAARRALGPQHRDAVIDAVQRPEDGVLAAVVAIPTFRRDHAFALHVAVHMAAHPDDDLAVPAAQVAAWDCADDVPEMLLDRDLRDWGLLLAEAVPTEEVLAALLDMPVPADLDPRRMYARALASMADPAAAARLDALFAADESDSLAEARELAGALLGAG